jgi:hypothetical protein
MLDFTEQQLQQSEPCEMRLLTSVAGCRRMGVKRNTDIRQEFNTFDLGEEVKYINGSTCTVF